MKRITENIRNGACNLFNKGYGDVALGRCQYISNVTLGKSVDLLGRERFHPLKLRDHFNGKLPQWIYEFSVNTVKIGENCCSDETISFHYNSIEEMYFFGNLKDQKKIKNVYKII